MSDPLVKKVDDLADAVGKDQKRQDAIIAKMADPDAETLHGKILVLGGSSKKTGYLSQDPTATYKDGQPAGTQAPYLINDPSFTLSTPNTATAVNEGDQGKLEAWINETLVDSFDLASVFDASKEDGNQTYTPANSANGKITVTAVGVYNKIWQKLNARMNITAADLVRGYNSLVLKHVGTSTGEQISQVFEVFYDDSGTVPAIASINLEIGTAVIKHLSGVQYLGIGSTVKVSTIINKVADNCYVLEPVEFSGLKGVSTTKLGVADAAVSGLSNPPNVGETMQVSQKLITLGVANQCTLNGRISAKPINPFGTHAVKTSDAQFLLVDTLNSPSSKTLETFNTEAYRLPANYDFNSGSALSDPLTGHWDSSQALADGDVQFGIIADNKHGMFLARSDYRTAKPANTANYSAFSQNGQLKRFFVSPAARSNCKVVIHGVSSGLGAKGSGKLNCFVTVPGQTARLDAAKDVNPAISATTEDAGALMGSVSYAGGKATFTVDFKGKSTNSSNNRIGVEIVLLDPSIKPSAVEVIW